MKMSELKLITASLLDEVSHTAQTSPRRRKNHNFHSADDAHCHRLLNAIEPDSYVAPHRHLDLQKAETMLVLRGRLGLVIFNDEGQVQQSAVLSAGGGCCGVDIPCGVWHTVLGLESGTVFFEAKAGPYVPLQPQERAPWAPLEGDPETITYLAGLRALFSSV